MKLRIWAKAVKDTIQHHAESVASAVDAGSSFFTDSEVLEDVPIIGTGLKILQARDTFMETRFRRNCLALLDACKRVEMDARQAAMEELSSDHERFEDFADTLLLIATDSSKPLKATIVGNLLAALMQGKLDYVSYNDLVHIVHSASIPALNALETYLERNENGSASGLAVPKEEPLLMSIGLGSRYGNRFMVTDQGVSLFRLGFHKAVSAN